jgi:aminopeptidase C
LYLGQMYVNNSKDCTKTDFEKKAIYNLATQTVQKAGVAEPKLKPTSDKMTQDYAPKSLTPSDISNAKMNGKSVTIGCWINETISFPAK